MFEGVDGAGKSTQVALLAARLRQAKYAVVCLKEPTEGPWGQKIRQLAQHGRDQVEPSTELEWFLQDRQEDVQQHILPALRRGQIVLLDRYYFSTIAYQGARHRHWLADIQTRNEAFAPPPDLLLWFDIPPAQSLQRVQQRGAASHYERLEYLEEVAEIFRGMQFPYLRRLDATESIATVQEAVWAYVQPLLRSAEASGRPLRHEGDSGTTRGD
ncbi:MAG: dTMP kinase [Candidatus Tectimicrobiota bacterium]